MRRIILIANKSWECEPILNALLSNRFSPDSRILFPQIVNLPFVLIQGEAKPRAIWLNFNNITIELWCIQDVMKIDNSDDKELFSSSQIKKDNIHKIFGYQTIKPSLVIALGTAGFGDDKINNIGCVIVGSKTFIHNFHPNGENSKSVWDSDSFEKIIDSPIEDVFFNLFDSSIKTSVEAKLIKPFNNPSDTIQIIADNNLLSLSTVNITNYKDYDTSDQKGSQAVKEAGLTNTIGSIETTHGIIRLASESRFIFISGITDRACHFNDDVNGKDSKGNQKTEAQNYPAAFNVGILLATILPKIADYIDNSAIKE